MSKRRACRSAKSQDKHRRFREQMRRTESLPPALRGLSANRSSNPTSRTFALSHFRTFALPHFRTSALPHFRTSALRPYGRAGACIGIPPPVDISVIARSYRLSLCSVQCCSKVCMNCGWR